MQAPKDALKILTVSFRAKINTVCASLMQYTYCTPIEVTAESVILTNNGEAEEHSSGREERAAAECSIHLYPFASRGYIAAFFCWLQTDPNPQS